MERVFSDFKFVFRSLKKSPLFVVVAVLSLALGIGANSAIFSLLDQVLLRSLPVKDPQALVAFNWDGSFHGFIWNSNTFSYSMYRAFAQKSGSVFDGVIARFSTPVDLGWRGAAERTNAELVSGNYFQILGVGTAIGRTLLPGDDQLRDAEPYVVLSYNYWQKRFGGGPEVLNRTVEINGHPMTIVGIAERGFRGTDTAAPTDVFLPLAMKKAATPTWDQMDQRNAVWLSLMARLRPGVSLKQAQASATILYRQEQAQDLKENTHASERFRREYLRNKFWLIPAGNGFSSIRDQFSTPLLVLMAMVGVLLLIACGNVANLLVARAANRQKEIAVRLSLGASKSAIIRLVLIESLALSLVGGALGLLVASWSGALLLRVLPFETFAHVVSTAPDSRILLFTFGVSVLAAVIFGLTPALQIAKPDLLPTLKNEARSVVSGGGLKLRKGMVIAQISLSLLLLVGAGLFARSLYNLRKADTGMRTDHLLTFSLDPSLAGYTAQRERQLLTDLQEKLAALPGTDIVSGAEIGLLMDNQAISTTEVQGFTPKPGESINPDVNAVLPEFFSTMGIPLVAGRDFKAADRMGAPKTAIVNEMFVQKFVQGRNPIGTRIGFSRFNTKLDMQIVGVIKDAKTLNLKHKIDPQVWTPAVQDDTPGAITYYIRTRNKPETMARLARRTIRQQDPSLPIYDVKAFETQINETHYVDRLISMLSGAFGILATLLAAIGLYGVMAFTVARRTQEIGIRMALGAERRKILSLVMRDVAMLTAIGIGAAVPLAFGIGKLVQKQLFEVTPMDPATVASAALLLAAVALFAGYVPALRATRIDPMNALRWE